MPESQSEAGFASRWRSCEPEGRVTLGPLAHPGSCLLPANPPTCSEGPLQREGAPIRDQDAPHLSDAGEEQLPPHLRAVSLKRLKLRHLRPF